MHLLTEYTASGILITLLYNSVINAKEGGGFLHPQNGLTQTILESATAEFLAHGYEKASMRTIAQKANVTTGALYARYPNKDALFSALVEPVVKPFIDLCAHSDQYGFNMTMLHKPQQMWEKSKDTSSNIVELIYSNQTAFSLLINCATGSSHAQFIETIIAIEEAETLAFLGELRKQGYAVMDISQTEIHMFVSAQCYAMFEIVRHDIPKEQALVQLHHIVDFFTCGWNKFFGLQ